jgi:ATP-binding cassette subfamily B protein
MLGMLLSFHWTVSLVLAVAALPGVLVKLKFSRVRWRWQRRRTETERRAWYKHWLLTSAEHAKELRLFGLGEHFRERYSNLRSTLRKESVAISRRKAVADLLTEVLATLMVYGSLAFIAWRTFLGLITIGSMVMYFQAFRQGLGYLRGLLGNMADLYEGNLFLRNLFEFLDIRSEVKDPPDPVPFPVPMTRGLELEDVTFSYPATDRRVLEDVSLKIDQGEMVALVGENGSGKTTLVKLICRLYDPDSGSIRIDGTPLRQFSVEELRSNISVLFQDYAMYHLSASENIGLGDIRRENDIDATIRAAKTAGVHALISGMPQGYETVLGRRFRGGQEISTGEWQRIALARAFFRDAGLVILDEPTSALDARAEEDLFSAFRKLAAGRTSLVISHRFSTVRMADRIAVLDGGRIVEVGSHDELMAGGGLYSRMYTIAARAYL